MNKCTVKMNRKVFDFATVDGSPGPAAYGYQTTVGRKNRMPTIPNEPAFTVKPRLDVNHETESPGPVYNLARLTRWGRADGPKFSIGMKLGELAASDSPGPAAYKPETGQRPKIKILLPLKTVDARADNPGPNVYKLPSTLSRKAVILAKKLDDNAAIESPGPAVYHTVPLNKYKSKAPTFSLAKKFEDPLVADEWRNPAPGPQAYKPKLDFKYKNMPKFSFGMRRPDKFPPLVVCGDEVKKKKF